MTTSEEVRLSTYTPAGIAHFYTYKFTLKNHSLIAYATSYIVYSMLGISIKYEYPSLTMSHSPYGSRLAGFPTPRIFSAAMETVYSSWTFSDTSAVYQVVLLFRYSVSIPVTATR